MSRCPRPGIVGLLLLLGLGLPLPARAGGGVEDRAHLFQGTTRYKADEAIEEIHRRTHKDLFIETLPGLSAEEQVTYREKKHQGQAADYFRELAEQRARRAEVNGVYVLLCGQPSDEQPARNFWDRFRREMKELSTEQILGHAVVVWPPSNDDYFPEQARKDLDKMFGNIRVADKNKDKMLLDAVKFAGDELEFRARELHAPPPDIFRWTYALWAAAGLTVAWIVLGIVRARVAVRQGNAAPVAGANLALSALYGAAGVLWLFQAWRAPRREAAAPSPPEPAPAPPMDDVPPHDPIHPDDREALARRPEPWTPEDTEATSGHDHS
jgi:hypothetical protein